jgi:hypothetical protein
VATSQPVHIIIPSQHLKTGNNNMIIVKNIDDLMIIAPTIHECIKNVYMIWLIKG